MFSNDPVVEVTSNNKDNPKQNVGILKERKLSDKLAKLLDTYELDMEWIPWAFAMHHGTAMQKRMFDLCMAFIRHWSNRYASGDIGPDQILYPVCQQCYNMLKPLDDAAQAELNSPRARRLRRIAHLESKPYGRHAENKA